MTAAADPHISVCFASRDRPAGLHDAVASLLDRASQPDGIEVLVGMDPDDPQLRAAARQLHRATRFRPARIWVAPQRFGYCRLHDYLNELATQARGTWCLWWNDDMRMLTAGWDDIIRTHRPAILWPAANHVQHANIAPAWPRSWSDRLGHVSPTTHMDTFLQALGEVLGRHDQIPVQIVHDRADVTGGHDDATYAEGRKLLGPEGMAPGFDDTAFEAAVARDAAILRPLLEG